MTLEENIAAEFDLGGRVLDVRPYGHGLINDTFVVTIEGYHRAVLQRLNRRVFPRPGLIVENLRTLLDHIHAHRFTANPGPRELQLPTMFAARDGKDFVIDEEGGFWRAMGFVENTRTYETITHSTQAEEAGFALGRFHALIHDLDPARLHETLPGFHNTPGYFVRFLRASARPQRTAANQDLLYCLQFVETRWNLTRVLETARREGKLAVRAIHGDTKLNNFLFDENSSRAVSLIDLDTVQPGLIQYDIGDCLRSCANPAGESPTDIGAVRFDLDIGHALLRQYLAETRSFLTQADYDYIYDAIHLIPFELGLRFLTDHLEGDCYFKTEWRGQNLHRAMVQFRLTESIERNERPIRSLAAYDGRKSIG
jgi:hypothetical protein